MAQIEGERAQTLFEDELDVDLRAQYEDEYRKLLDFRTEEELRAIAKTRGIDLAQTERQSMVAELAAQLSDPQATRAQLLATDPVGKGLLAYLHLVLTPGRGLSAESILSELTRRQGSGDIGQFQHRRQDVSGRAIVQQLMALSRRALVLPFKQRSQSYYSIPLAVRACLPPMADLFPPYAHASVRALQVRETSLAALIRTLYEVWTAIAALSMPGTRRRLDAQAPLLQDLSLSRQPGENQWPSPRARDRLLAERPYARLGYMSEREQAFGRFGQPATLPVPEYRLGDADRAILKKETGCSDDEIEFYYILLEGLGAITAEPGQPITTHREVIERFLTLSPDAQLHTAFHAWETNTVWSELEFVLRSKGDGTLSQATGEDSTCLQLRLRRAPNYAPSKPTDLYAEWQAGRKALLRFLSLLEMEQWVSLSGFLETVFEINPNLLHARADRSVWWLESVQTRKQFGTTYDDWQGSYGRFVVATIAGPLAWLGAVSLGCVDDKPVAFRLTPAGAYALGRLQALAEPDLLGTFARPGPVPDQPVCAFGQNVTLSLVPNRVPGELHDLLRSVGELQVATPERFVYRITPEGIHEWAESFAQEAHEPPTASLDILIALLNALCHDAHAQEDVPATWRERFHMWVQNYGQLHVYEDITAIELADDYALRELLASTSLREHLVYQFSPRLVAIQTKAVDILVEEMEKRGYTPQVK